MRRTKKIQTETDVTIEIICNKCGDSCTPEDARKPRGTPVKWVDGEGFLTISEEESVILHGPNAYGLIETTVSGGYDSSHLEDVTSYTFSVCEPCLAKFFESNVI